MTDRGCDVARSFFICEQCPAGMLVGGYWSSGRGVVVCENVERSTAQVGRTLRHELVHAFDWCRVEMNPSNCLHTACTEIRAANLSGDCSYAMELIRGRGWSITKHKPECVRRIAITSLQTHPACAANAERAVEMAFQHCWGDTQVCDPRHSRLLCFFVCVRVCCFCSFLF